MADLRDDPEIQRLIELVRQLAQRVDRLERRLDEELSEAPPDSFQTRTISRSALPKRAALESRIGSQWLNRVGVVAVLFGVAYLLRYAFVNNWISAVAWIWFGIVSGIAIIIASEWFRRGGYRVLSLSLKSTGIGVCYLSLWAGLELYKLVSGVATFIGLVILGVLNVVLALLESSQILAALALVGGFLTPLLISIPSGDALLFVWIGVLDAVTAAFAITRMWWKLLPLSFGGTVVLCTVWYTGHYTPSESATFAIATTLFFAIFCAAAARTQQKLSTVRSARWLAVFEALNPAIYFIGLDVPFGRSYPNGVAVVALGLSIVYFILAWRRQASAKGVRSLVPFYGGLGIAFSALMLAVLLPLDWLSLAWFVEAAAIIAIGFWRDLAWVRWDALLLLSAAVVKAFAFDVWQLGLGYRTLSFIGLGVLLLIISFVYQRYGFSLISSRQHPNRPFR